MSKSQPKNVVEEGRIFFFYRSETTAKTWVETARNMKYPVIWWQTE